MFDREIGETACLLMFVKFVRQAEKRKHFQFLSLIFNFLCINIRAFYKLCIWQAEPG